MFGIDWLMDRLSHRLFLIDYLVYLTILICIEFFWLSLLHWLCWLIIWLIKTLIGIDWLGQWLVLIDKVNDWYLLIKSLIRIDWLSQWLVLIDYLSQWLVLID